MFLKKAKETRIRELETDIRRRVDELRAKANDPHTSEEEREKARHLLARVSARNLEEGRDLLKEEK